VVRRPLMQREVTEVAAPINAEEEMYQDLQSTMSAYEGLQRKKELANINNFMADANLQMMNVTNKWRVDNQADPTNQDALGKLSGDYDKILSLYGQKVGMFGRGDWQQVSNKLKQQYKLDTMLWGQKQTNLNIVSNVNDSRDKNLLMAAQVGQSFDLSKAAQDWRNQKAALEGLANTGFMPNEIKEHIRQYQFDYMDMFLRGAIKKDPWKAEVMLNQLDFQNDLGNDPKRIDALREVIKKSKEQNRYATAVAQNDAEDKLLTGYFTNSDSVNILVLDKAVKSGEIRPEFAIKMKNMIESPRTVGAESKDDTYIDFTNRFADLKSGKKNKSITIADVMQFRNDVIDAHAQGRLGVGDTRKFLRDTQNDIDTRLNKVADTALSKTNPKTFLQAISWWSDEYADKRPEVKARMYRNVMDRLRNGQDPYESINAVIKEETNRANPNTVFCGGTPNNIISSTGIKQGIYRGISDSKSGYTISNGQVVAKGSSGTQQAAPIRRYRVGDKLSLKGDIYIVTGFDKDGEPLVEKVNAKIE